MEFKEIAKGVKVPVLGLGTWEMGGRYDVDKSHDKEAVDSLKRGIELGMTHIDTAEIYANGHTEEIVAQAIKSFDRKNLFITTKVRPDHLEYDNLIGAAKASLKRLGTKYIDMYLIHAPNPSIPIEETMKAMDFLIEQKIVRFIGVSNFNVKQMKEAQENSMNKIVANQVYYNLLVRNNKKVEIADIGNMESEVLPYCQKNGIMFIAYRPLEKGLIIKGKIPLLDELSKKYNKTPAQIALNWLISKDQVITIPKASNIKHVEENAGAIGWKLDYKDMKILNRLKPQS